MKCPINFYALWLTIGQLKPFVERTCQLEFNSSSAYNGSFTSYNISILMSSPSNNITFTLMHKIVEVNFRFHSIKCKPVKRYDNRKFSFHGRLKLIQRWLNPLRKSPNLLSELMSKSPCKRKYHRATRRLFPAVSSHAHTYEIFIKVENGNCSFLLSLQIYQLHRPTYTCIPGCIPK